MRNELENKKCPCGKILNYLNNMDDQIEKLLRETKDIVEENNKILKSIRRSNRISGFFRFVYWIVIIALTIGAVAYIQPYLDSTMKLYNQLEETNNKISNTQNSFTDGIKSFFLGSSPASK